MASSSQSLAPSSARSAGVPQLLARLARNRLLLAAVALAIVAAIAATVVGARARAASSSYITAPVVQQSLTQTVTASGTVNPQNTVTVGTQVSGTISEIDVDYNSVVHQGEVLARLDPSTLQAQLGQADAQLAQAQDQARAQADAAASAADGIPSADATVARDRSALALAQNTLQRDQNLLSQGYVARATVQSDQDAVVAAQSAMETAQAQSAQAAAASAGGGASTSAAQAAVAADEAVVQQDQLNVQRSVITSPVNGTVIARDVSVGQTVAASLQTPTLFTIAQDLTKMEVDISVGEPDIGSVRAGESVDFTVLAYPNETFHGVVTQVRVNPTTVNNVVTYDVITKVQNDDQKLLPGMTATATIDVATAPNALVVPLQALQFHAGGHGAAHGASPWGQTAQGSSNQTIVAGSKATLFTDVAGHLAPVQVQVQLVNGTQAAVNPVQGTLAPGTPVAIASSNGAHAAHTSTTGSMYGAMRGLH